MLGTSLLIAGLIFPGLSVLTSVASLATRWKHGRYASPVFIPFIGPVLLTCWVFVAGHSRWVIPLVWLLDLGTVAFLIVIPRLIHEWWQISPFTRLMTLRGSQGMEEATLSVHRGGRYLLRKSWNRPEGERGIVALGETGTFFDDGDVLAIQSDHGLNRRIQRIDQKTFHVSEADGIRPDLKDYSLHGWRLHL